MNIDQLPSPDDGADRRRRHILVALIVMGIALPLASYLWKTGFHYDEGMVIRNIQDLSFRQLAGPLMHEQAAPLGYLWLIKALYLLAGLCEWTLRLPSVLAAAGGMLLLWPVAKRYVGPAALPWAIVLVAASDNILVYAARVKPYTIDALATSGLLYLAVRLKDASPLRYILAVGVAGASLFWLSYPSCFVFAAAAGMGLLKLARSRRWRDWLGCAAVMVAVAASMYAMLRFTGGQRSKHLMTYWAERGFPPAWENLSIRAVWKWPIEATYRIFEDAVRPIGYFAVAMSGVGIVSMWRDRKRRLALGLLVVPLALNFIAACLKLYPWVGSRISMWNIPIVAMLTAAGIAHVLAWLPAGARRRNGVIIGAIIVAVPVGLALYHVTLAGHRETHGRPLVQHALANLREGDCIAIAGTDEFGIYLRRGKVVPVNNWEQGVCDPAEIVARTDWARCWLLVRATGEKFRRLRDQFLVSCDVLEKRTSLGTELYLLTRKTPLPVTAPVPDAARP